MGSEVIIVPIVFLTFYMLIRTLSNNRLRKHLADRDIKSEELKYLYAEINQTGKVSMNSFKLGLLFSVLGLDIIVVDSMDLYDANIWAVFLISGGLILLFAEKLDALFNKNANDA